MISEQIENFWESLFDVEKQPGNFDISNGSVLTLPLERNAIEQTNYANWLYGEGLTNSLKIIKSLQLSEDPNTGFQFDYPTNTFSFTKPEGCTTDEFYMFFDYLKEVYIENNYRVVDAVKENISVGDLYTEKEKYVLINSASHHLVKLEVVNNKTTAPKIIGLGYPEDENASNNNPHFFRIIKAIINRP